MSNQNYQNETKTNSTGSVQACQNCKQDFTIEPDDFSFYEKIKVPPPTFCPECRLQRRLVWMKGLEFFKRKCDLCGEMKLSMYHPDAHYKVFCARCWWSDDWDAKDYAKEYDPSRSFLEQWNELLHEVPILGLSLDRTTEELSPYSNHVGNSKNCYLIYYSDYNEDSANSYQLTRAKNVYDSADIMDTDSCYDSSNVYKSYNIVRATGNNRSCYDCFFIRDCEGCHDCFGLASARNKSYVFLGEQLSKEEYKKRIQGIDLGSYQLYQEWNQKAEDYFKTIAPKPNWDTLSENISGSYVFQSKNCKECFNVTTCQDSKYLMMVKIGKVKDTYDYADWGENVEKVYECMTVGCNVSDVKFTHESGFDIMNVEYSKLSTGGSDHFGCVSIKKTRYCILNKQYSKDDYFKLKEKIILDMQKNPYINSMGHVYKYGEFFPPEFSPHFYNDTFASRLFPSSKQDILSRGLKCLDPENKEYSITIKTEDLSDDIKNVSDSIIEEIICCIKCKRGYRIANQELKFLRQHNLPLPRKCPFCRVWEKVDNWVLNMRLHERICDKCGVLFKTHYSKERSMKIFCKKCYQQEVY